MVWLKMSDAKQKRDEKPNSNNKNIYTQLASSNMLDILRNEFILIEVLALVNIFRATVGNRYCIHTYIACNVFIRFAVLFCITRIVECRQRQNTVDGSSA